jgi:hypothetical protein
MLSDRLRAIRRVGLVLAFVAAVSIAAVAITTTWPAAPTDRRAPATDPTDDPTVEGPVDVLGGQAAELRRAIPHPCALLDAAARRRLGLPDGRGTASTDFVAARCTWRSAGVRLVLSVALDPTIVEVWDGHPGSRRIEVDGTDRAVLVGQPVLGPAPEQPGDPTVAVAGDADGHLIVLERTGRAADQAATEAALGAATAEVAAMLAG